MKHWAIAPALVLLMAGLASAAASSAGNGQGPKLDCVSDREVVNYYSDFPGIFTPLDEQDIDEAFSDWVNDEGFDPSLTELQFLIAEYQTQNCEVPYGNPAAR